MLDLLIALINGLATYSLPVVSAAVAIVATVCLVAIWQDQRLIAPISLVQAVLAYLTLPTQLKGPLLLMLWVMAGVATLLWFSAEQRETHYTLSGRNRVLVVLGGVALIALGLLPLSNSSNVVNSYLSLLFALLGGGLWLMFWARGWAFVGCGMLTVLQGVILLSALLNPNYLTLGLLSTLYLLLTLFFVWVRPNEVKTAV